MLYYINTEWQSLASNLEFIKASPMQYEQKNRCCCTQHKWRTDNSGNIQQSDASGLISEESLK